MLLYHYSIIPKLDLIAEAGYLDTSPIDKRKLVSGESPFLWLSSNVDWEPTCFMFNPPAQLDQFVGRIRFVIDTNKITCKHVTEVQDRLPHWVGLINSGVQVGADHKEWYVVETPISLTAIEAIEFYDPEQKQWLNVQFDKELYRKVS